MSENTAEVEKLDITAFVDAFWSSFKRLWIVVLVLALGLGAFSFFRTRSTYVPAYKAEATVAVYSAGEGSSANPRSAAQLGTVFPYILTSGILKDVIMEDLGVTSLPANIKVTNVEETNLVTISVSSDDPDKSYQTLLSIIRNYPKVAEYVVGETVMEIVDDSGIPSDSGQEVAVRGNAVRGALIGLVLGLGVVAMHMLMFRTIRSSKDVKSFSNVDHLGTLPIYRKKKRRSGFSGINILEHNVQQDYLESIRLIRTRVMRKLEESGHKVLMVTSSVPGEGKSTVAANLAISLSGKNKRVVLVDCDLRHSSLREVFQFHEDQPGIIEVLAGREELKDVLVSYKRYGINLSVIFGSSKNLTNHSGVLGTDKMGKIIEELKKDYDIVLLDTPPSATLVDALLVAKYADEALYVIMADYARRSVVVGGMQELKNTGIEIGGFILNGSKGSIGGYYGHSYYGYKSRYYEEEKKEDQ
ncbi:MAG: polysaccharide biosynthesis tyrosine autokinase [Erysipelotrichaceae bacterium]|nr:polysaccharide biosynthesis tyrosine autokinase [Erysipelotrichaceae bacterium]